LALVDVAREPFLYGLCGLYAVTFGGFVGLSSSLPFFLHDHYQMGVVAAGSLTALSGLVGSLIRPLGGYVADWVGGLVVLPSLLGAMTLLLALVGTLPTLPWAVGVIVAAVAVMGFGNGVVFQVASGRYAKQMGMVSGVVGAAGGLGGFLVPLCLGWLKDVTGSFSFGFWLFAACAGLGVIGSRYLKERSRRVGNLPLG
jgi:NNP family nitrate/nitrite transporter-like MFS transporter